MWRVIYGMSQRMKSIDLKERSEKNNKIGNQREPTAHGYIYASIAMYVSINVSVSEQLSIAVCALLPASLSLMLPFFVSAGCLGSRRLGNNIYIAVYIFCDTATSQLAPLEGSPQDLGGMGPRDLGDQGDLGSAISTFGVVQHILRPQFRESPSQAEQTTKSRGEKEWKGEPRWDKVA